MEEPPTAPPRWHSESHRERYRRLSVVRRAWCRRPPARRVADLRGRTVPLDGAWIDDIPSFYLALGEAVNGRGGYFGASLDALSDCLCGGFGVLPPLTLRLSHYDAVRAALDGRAWCRFRAEGFREAVARGETTEGLVASGYLGDGSPPDVARWTATYEAALAGGPFDASGFGSYFDAVVTVLEAGGARLVPFRLTAG